MSINRRGLIRTLLFTLASIPGPLLGARGTVDGFGSDAEAAPPSEQLSPEELEDLLAFAELLVEGRPLAPAQRDAFAVEIEARTALDDELLPLYRTTVSVLRRLVGRRFSALDASSRAALVARYQLGSRHVGPGDDLGPFGEEVRVLRTRALRSLIAAYYGSPAGWAVVGYGTFPGRCSDLVRYTRAER